MAFTGSREGMAAYAGPSLFQPHRARDAIRDAHKKKIDPILCYYAGLSSVPITRFLAPMNYDAVWIDWEHSSCNVETMTTMVHEAIFMSQGRTIPWVRVPGHDHAAIGYALDAGASIVVPQVDTVEQAKHVVSAAKFGSKQNGTRSAPPFRLIPYLTDMAYDSRNDVHKCLNDQAAIMIQIESLEGINNLDAILTEVPDIDIVWLGSLDARVSMNFKAAFGDPWDEPEWVAARDKFFQVIDKHDKPYGGFAFVTPPWGTPETFAKASERMAFCTVSADVMHLMNLSNDMRVAKEEIAKSRRGANGDKKDVVVGNGNGATNGSG
ncbi:HpcH/HpaI aldolase/citrate lyase family protein [Purpureocillium lilacinum]|uniref:HpcH/HpaI aldolase/citrate lyase family protein n=1 Tax=Purpureocillium lilacinum TaxID=33203 RepID=A0A179GM19_PURLI|nr:HpcH/HpaI aldolase/citrate lyase family protein [Purpureocillium lilacinum]